MKENVLYLRQNVQIEPLFNQWYVCLPMIAPALAPMLIANSHVKIMESYIALPDMHATLSKDPEMIGAPYINYEYNRVEEISDLLNKTKVEQTHMLEFALAVKQLDGILKQKAKGFSLESLYLEVPEILRGYVELVYDLNNNASIRFIEGLLYKSKYFDCRSQSIGLSLIEKDDRPFVLSTPRLEADNYLQLKIPFNSEVIDYLCSMRDERKPLDEIKEIVGLDSTNNGLFLSFLTSEVKQQSQNYSGEKIRVKYFGHACLLIESDNISILTDPNISYQYKCTIPRYTYADLPNKIDYVLITHGHLDHIVLETLLQIRYKIKNVIVPKSGSGSYADPSLKMLLFHLGFKNVFEVDELESVPLIRGCITSMPFMGEHHDLNIKAKAAYLLQMDGKNIYIAADSTNLEPKLYDYIHQVYGDINVLFIGMECNGAPLSWFYGHLLTSKLDRDMDYSRLGSSSDYQRAISIVEKLKCKSAYIYAMGLEPWLTYILSINYNNDSIQIKESDRFIMECNKRGILAQRLFAKNEIFV